MCMSREIFIQTRWLFTHIWDLITNLHNLHNKFRAKWRVVMIRPCGNAESLAIKRNIWARSLSYEAVCFNIFSKETQSVHESLQKWSVARNDIHLISVIFNFVTTTTNTQFNSGRKTIYSANIEHWYVWKSFNKIFSFKKIPHQRFWFKIKHHVSFVFVLNVVYEPCFKQRVPIYVENNTYSLTCTMRLIDLYFL